MAKLRGLGDSDLGSLLEDGYAYTDKTDLIYRLTHETERCFLARPYLFGKSLLVTTLKSYFEGKKDLFRGLAIEQLETEWAVHPVLHLDLCGACYTRPEALENLIELELTHWEEKYGASPEGESLEARLTGLIRRAHEQTGQRVVFLVDSYETPIRDAIGDPALQAVYTEMLSRFFGCITTVAEHLRFVFFTGLTHYAPLLQTSAFDQITDLSFQPAYATLCGITEKELRHNYAVELQEMADAEQVSVEVICDRIKRAFNGYCFAKNSENVYNPFILLMSLKHRKLSHDHPHLVRRFEYLTQLRKDHYRFDQIGERLYHENELSAIHSYEHDLIPLLYQNGYLTLKAYDAEADAYRVGIPCRSDGRFVFAYALSHSLEQAHYWLFNGIDCLHRLKSGQMDEVLDRFSNTLAYLICEGSDELEEQVQNFCFMFYRLAAYELTAGYHSEEGYIELSFHTDDLFCLIAFKACDSANEALEQLKSRAKQAISDADPRKKFLIGISYSLKARGIGQSVIEEA